MMGMLHAKRRDVVATVAAALLLQTVWCPHAAADALFPYASMRKAGADAPAPPLGCFLWRRPALCKEDHARSTAWVEASCSARYRLGLQGSRATPTRPKLELFWLHVPKCGSVFATVLAETQCPHARLKTAILARAVAHKAPRTQRHAWPGRQRYRSRPRVRAHKAFPIRPQQPPWQARRAAQPGHGAAPPGRAARVGVPAQFSRLRHQPNRETPRPPRRPRRPPAAQALGPRHGTATGRGRRQP